VVVTPTLKAATVAARELGSRAFSAAWLAHQYGYRWDEHGVWTRLAPGQRERHRDPHTAKAYTGPAPQAALRPGDLLLVDEAGMLDQDTARALLRIADQAGARVALVGDRHQLPAVGRGGVLDLAARWATPQAFLTLDVVHRFSDPEYARISLAMRTGEPLRVGGEPRGERRGAASGGVFDALVARDQIRIYPSEAERTQALAVLAAASTIGGEHEVLVMADTREQVGTLNGAIRDRLVAAGRVQDTATFTTQAGERLGVGDRVATRRNDRALQVANRDTWTLTGIAAGGTATLTGSTGQQAVLPASYLRQHVELAYASTCYGAQGETSSVGHFLLGEHTGAAGAYVGMTRGRDTNIAHLVAGSAEDARAQWISTFSRDRGDLGPAHAARLASLEAATYATGRPLEQVLEDLRAAWTLQADLAGHIARATSMRDELAQIVPLRAESDPQIAHLRSAEQQAWADSGDARTLLRQTEATITTATSALARDLLDAWDRAYPDTAKAAETIRAGAGRFGRGRAEVNAARASLASWARGWQPILSDVTGLPVEVLLDPDQLSTRMPYNGSSALHAAIGRYAEHAAGQARPELAAARRAVDVADQHARNAKDTRTAAENARADHFDELGLGSLAYTDRPAAQLAAAENNLSTLTQQLTQTQDRISELGREPAIRTLPDQRLQTEHDTCIHDHEREKDAQARAAWAARNAPRPSHEHEHHHDLYRSGADHGISR
jgi:hypothetical protein